MLLQQTKGYRKLAILQSSNAPLNYQMTPIKIADLYNI